MRLYVARSLLNFRRLLLHWRLEHELLGARVDSGADLLPRLLGDGERSGEKGVQTCQSVIVLGEPEVVRRTD